MAHRKNSCVSAELISMTFLIRLMQNKNNIDEDEKIDFPQETATCESKE